jgi:chemotaxis protein MotB
MLNKAPLLLLMFSILSCGVSKQKYADLQAQANQLESAKVECEQKLTATSSSKEELSQELEKKTQTYENLMGSLKDEINAGKIKISEMKDRLTVNLIDKILFDSGSIEIKDEGKVALTKIADVLKSVQGKRIQVEGHTDNVRLGPTLAKKFPTNWELSVARATAVVKHLSGNGVPDKRLSATGYSEFQPVSSNDTPDGKRQNRRIEIVLVPELTVEPAAAAPAATPSTGGTP